MKKIRIWTWIVGLGISVAIAGTGTYLFVKKFLEIRNENAKLIPINGSRGTAIELLPNEKISNEKPVRLIEYEYKGKSVLGEKGLMKLNEKIKSDLPYGAEIFDLKSISFNNVYSLPKQGSVSGQYNPLTNVLDIDLRWVIDEGKCNLNIDEIVEYVFTIVLHEYGHHLSNSYITAISYDDSLNLNYEDKNDAKYLYQIGYLNTYKNIPKTFYDKWTTALNYNNDILGNLRTTSKPISSEQGTTQERIYNRYSPKALFEYSNIYQNNATDNKNKYITRMVDKYNYSYTIAKEFNQFVNYYYSMDELLTRNLVSFNYINKNNSLDDFWYYCNSQPTPKPNSYSYDIFERNNIINSGNSYSIENNEIYSSDNFFGGTIKTNNGEQKINSTVEELYESYNEVFGYGKFISQIFMNNDSEHVVIKKGNKLYLRRNEFSNKSFNKVRISGYINKNKKNKYKKIVFKSKNDSIIAEANINIIKSNKLKAKESIFSKNYSYGNSDDFVQYVSDEIDFSKIDVNKIYSIAYWTDDNNDNKIDVTKEVKDVEEKDVVTSRPISTFREAFKYWKKYKIPGAELELVDGFYYEGVDDTKNKNIYKIVKNEEDNTKFTFRSNVN